VILLSIGNLGDLLIQAALLRAFDRAGVAVAVPESYAGVTAELFPSAEIIALADQSSDGRWLMRRRIDRATGIGLLKADLESRFPGREVISIALTDDLIQMRGLNIYEAYDRALRRQPPLAATLGALPSPNDEWRPLGHLAAWGEGAAAGAICICPWGGLGVKQVDARSLGQLMHECAAHGLDVRVMASPRDDVSVYPFLAAQNILKLPASRLVRDAADALAASRLVIAVDTAWYHLAAMVGAPVLALPGPRSLAHFRYPGRTRGVSIPEQRLCVDCYSADRCVVTGSPRCDAQPDAMQLVSALRANLNGSAPLHQATPAPFAQPSPMRRRLFRAAFHVIDVFRPLKARRPS
jgi:hypothetical protein